MKLEMVCADYSAVMRSEKHEGGHGGAYGDGGGDEESEVV